MNRGEHPLFLGIMIAYPTPSRHAQVAIGNAVAFHCGLLTADPEIRDSGAGLHR